MESAASGSGWWVANIQVAPRQIIFCFNDGGSNWDENGEGNPRYSTVRREVWVRDREVSATPLGGADPAWSTPLDCSDADEQLEQVRVLLQGFYAGVPGNGVWWTALATECGAISSAGFTDVWLPPAMKGGSSDSDGYDPYDYYDLGSYSQCGEIRTKYGLEQDYRRCVAAFTSAGIRVTADIDVNHCAPGSASEDGTATEFTGVASGKFRRNRDCFHPCSFADADEGALPGLPDLCHRNPYVTSEFVEYGHYLRSSYGINGIRWADAHLVPPSAVRLIVTGLPHALHMGDLPIYDRVHLRDWAGVSGARAFDYPLFREISRMCNDRGGNSSDLRKLFAASLVLVLPDAAVTFVANHITEADQATVVQRDAILGYAFILTLGLGLPCVYYKHFSIDGLAPEISTLIVVLRAHKGLPGCRLCFADEKLLVMQRGDTPARHGYFTCINAAPTPRKVAVQSPWAGRAVTILAGAAELPEGSSADEQGCIYFTVPARSYVVIGPGN
eukprot:TRINITY_DN9036_c0_g1_i1.p1 TRINITY_DN9036_c0_g1~~TRINITY_DN9036_c0_g1_i1.p1  ORF type:complete len:502 (-),score=55.89 TRINITY_DN9036_c0_g1_i1:25-1530(-)